MTDKEWIELCNERHIKVIDFDYRNCTRDEAIAALDLLEEAHSIAFPNLYDEDNKATHYELKKREVRINDIRRCCNSNERCI